jgi:cholesterol transport system auxiliary component
MRLSNAILVCGFATLLGLAGCASKVRYPSFYVLNVPAPPSRGAHAAPILGSAAVQEFTAAGFLKGGSIVYRPSAEQVGFYDYNRWAEDPRQVVTKAFVQEIQSRAIFSSVQLYNGRESPDYLLTGTLDHLEEVDEGRKVSIQVSVSARLIDQRTSEVLWSDTTTKTGTVDERSVPGVVAEMSRQLGSAVSSLVSSMQDHLSTTASLSGRSRAEQ